MGVFQPCQHSEHGQVHGCLGLRSCYWSASGVHQRRSCHFQAHFWHLGQLSALVGQNSFVLVLRPSISFISCQQTLDIVLVVWVFVSARVVDPEVRSF